MSDDELPQWPRRRRRPFFGGEFFDDMDDAFKEMEETMKKEFKELSKKVPRELVRERTLPDGSKVHEWGPFVYGYSITIGPDGKPQVREFGNVKPEARPRPGKPRLDIKEEREPLVDIMDTDGQVKVVAELPGVERENIKLHGTEKSLTISVDAPQRKYYKEVDLPAIVDPKGAKSTYKNGVLEVSMQKKNEEKPKGEPIRVE